MSHGEYLLWLFRLSATVAWCRELQAALPSSPQSREEVVLRTCAACGKRLLQMLKCSRCKAAFYCDAACQERHWREHKAACGAAPAGT